MSIGDNAARNAQSLSFMDVDASGLAVDKKHLPKEFTLHNPDLDEFSSSEVMFFSLPESNQKVTNSAFGVAVDDDSVTIAQAIIDLEKILGPAQYNTVYSHSLKTQADFYGFRTNQDCNYRSRCTREKCFRFHNRPGESKFFPTAVRASPDSLKYSGDKKAGPGFSEDRATFAVVLEVRYPRVERRKIDWNTPIGKPVFKRQAVSLQGCWKDDVLKDLAESDEAEDLDDLSNEACLEVFMGFCRHMAFRGLPGKLQHASDLNIHNTPNFNKETITLDPTTRSFHSVRRCILDSLVNFFNTQAVIFLCRKEQPGTQLLGRKSAPIPKDILPLLHLQGGGLTGSQLSHIIPHLGLPLRAFSVSLPKTYMFGPPEQFLSHTQSEFVEAKFNVPMREFSSLHNLRLLTATIDSHSAPALALDSRTEQAVLSRLQKLAVAEMQKIRRCHINTPLDVVCATLGDGTSLIFSESLGIAVERQQTGSSVVAGATTTTTTTGGTDPLLATLSNRRVNLRTFGGQ